MDSVEFLSDIDSHVFTSFINLFGGEMIFV